MFLAVRRLFWLATFQEEKKEERKRKKGRKGKVRKEE